MDMASVTSDLIKKLKSRFSLERGINSAVENFFAQVNLSESREVEESISLLTQQFSLTDISRSSLAATICGILVEKGYSPSSVVVPFIATYKQFFQTALPSLAFIKKEIDAFVAKDDDEGTSEDDLIKKLKEKRRARYLHEVRAVEALDKFFPCGISIFSSSTHEIKRAAEELPHVFDFSGISQGCYWFSVLFGVLFFEPLLVIDTINHKSIVAEMSGVVDNMQLNLLLMGTPELNSVREISVEFLDVIKGSGPHSLDKSINGKWNLNNWEYLADTELNTQSDKYSDSRYWIWNEGTPKDIHVFDGYRVVVLSEPSYRRGLNIQRTFGNLKASVIVKKILNEREIQEWIKKLSSL